MLTCLCDAYYGEVGIAATRVLRHAGCDVHFEPAQTCCGQPPFNSGSWDEARQIARHCQAVLFFDETPVVTPSSSCAAMVHEGYPMLFPNEPRHHAWELSAFLAQCLGLSSWAGAKPYPRRVAFHPACHGRGIGLHGEATALLRSIPSLELVEFADPGQCCGFGGAFCVTEGKLSSEIGLQKLRTILDAGAEEIVSTDMGCLLHLRGLIDRHKMPLRTRHFVEILAEVLP